MSKLLYSFILTIFMGFSLSAQLSVDFQSNNLEPNNGETVEIDVYVSDFLDIVSTQYLILWDSTVLTYSNITNVTTDLPQFIFTEDPNGISSVGTPANMSNGLDGVLSVSWSQASTEPFTLPDNTRLFTIELRGVGDPCDQTDLSIGSLPFRPIEVVDANLNDIGAVANTLTFQLPGAGCGGGGNEDDVGFIGGTGLGAVGDTICMPVKVINFMDIQTFQGSLDWDPSELMFTGVNNINPGINGLTPGSFNTDSVATTGTISYAWFDFSGLNPLNFADSTTIFELCFIPLAGNLGDCFNVNFADVPTPIETSNSMGQALPFYTEAGKLCIGEEVIEPEGELVIMPIETTIDMGSNGCVDFMVMDFDSIGSIQYNVTWDPAILTYTDVNNFDPDMGLVAFNFFQTAADKIRLTWNEPSSSPAGLSLADGTIIYSMCFDAVGDCGSITTLEFIDDGGINIEIANGNAQEIPYTLKPADVTVTCGECTANDATITHPSCPETLTGSIIINCPDVTYSWVEVGSSNVLSTSNSLTGVGAGFYDCTVTNTITNEVSVINFTLNDPIAIDLSGESFDASCSTAGMIDLNCSGGTGVITCVWSGPTSIPNNVKNPIGLDPGSYTVVCTDENNCSADMNFFIDMVGGSETITVSTTPANCAGGGTIDAQWSGSGTNLDFDWDPDVADVNNVAAGTYNLTITDNDTGCSATATAIVGMNMSNPPMIDGAVVNAGCDGGSIDITISNGSGLYSYDWTGGLSGPNPMDVNPGDYDLTVTDTESGCTATASFEVTDEIDPLSISAQVVSDVSCFGVSDGNALVTFSGGCNTTCAVTNGGVPVAGGCSDLANIPVGDYVVTIIDENGNSTTASFSINGPAAAVAVETISITNLCEASNILGAIDISVSGGTLDPGDIYLYSWVGPNGFTFTGQDPINLADAGQYSVTVTDSNLCATEHGPIDVIVDTSEECIPNSVILTLGPAVITSDYNGVQISCNGDCDGTADIPILTGTAPFETILNGLSFTTDSNILSVTGLCEGSNQLTVTDAAGQSALAAIVIEEIDLISIQLDGEIECVEIGQSTGVICTEISGGTGTGFILEWSSDGDVVCEENLAIGNYILSVTDANGCSTERSFVVPQCQDKPPVACYTGLNVLTPNGDNHNDIFVIECAENNNNQLGIYDRYGKKIFNTSNYTNDWDGVQTDGTMLAEGPYFWILEVEFANGDSRIEKGTFTVLR